jgi:tetratricopeptide (TPR) repeat protein
VQDVLSLQSEVARAIAGQIRARVTVEEAARLEKARVVNPEAHEAYLLGRYYVATLKADSITRSIDYFQKAIRLDPAFALGYAGLSEAYRQADIWTGLGIGRHASEVRLAALKAIELDADLAEAHSALAGVKFQYDWDWPGTEASYQKALELNPNLSEAHSEYAFHLATMGRFDEANAHVRRATVLDPLAPRIMPISAGYCIAAGSTTKRSPAISVRSNWTARIGQRSPGWRSAGADGCTHFIGAQGATRRDLPRSILETAAILAPVTAARRAEPVRIRASSTRHVPRSRRW